METLERLMQHCQKTDSCWLWTGTKTIKGYGRIRINKKLYLPHRLMWEIENGPIPEKMLICHTCDNPPCMNPKHLFLGTKSDNAKDMYDKNRRRQDGIHNGNSKLTLDQVAEIRKLYATRQFTQSALAVKFGVSQRQISHIILLQQHWS